jgi:vesicle coat complex subunit
VANAVAALSEISEQSPQIKIFDLNGPTINKLLTALNECSEWGQVFILDAIANYSPKVKFRKKNIKMFYFSQFRMIKKHKVFVNV